MIETIQTRPSNLLTFIRDVSERNSSGHRLGLFRCACGNEKITRPDAVARGAAKSCGCILKTHPVSKIHGQKGTRTYSSWAAMMRRAECVDDKDYPRYGAVGIRVCARWKTFANFFKDMGVRPAETTLDRIDGRRGYEPGNCRWATIIQQNRNTKAFVWVSSPIGVLPLVDYAKHIEITNAAAHQRLKRGKLEGCEKL